jgi:hypothetical protein
VEAPTKKGADFYLPRWPYLHQAVTRGKLGLPNVLLNSLNNNINNWIETARVGNRIRSAERFVKRFQRNRCERAQGALFLLGCCFCSDWQLNRAGAGRKGAWGRLLYFSCALVLPSLGFAGCGRELL